MNAKDNVSDGAAMPEGSACLTSHLQVHDTPLHFAALRGHLEVSQWLHSIGADVNAKDSVSDGQR